MVCTGPKTRCTDRSHGESHGVNTTETKQRLKHKLLEHDIFATKIKIPHTTPHETSHLITRQKTFEILTFQISNSSTSHTTPHETSHMITEQKTFNGILTFAIFNSHTSQTTADMAISRSSTLTTSRPTADMNKNRS